MLKTIAKPTEEGMALQCRSEGLLNEVFFHGNLCLRDPFVVLQRVFCHPTYTFNDRCEYRLQVQGWSLLRPSHKAALVYIHMDPARYEPTHFSSFQPSTLSITVIALEKVAFGTAANGRLTYGGTSLLRPLFVRYVILPKFVQH